MTISKKRKPANTANEKLAASNEWADLDPAIMRGWLDEYRELSDDKRKHTPAIDRVYMVLFYLCSRQMYRDKHDARTINETIKQVSLNGVISYGSAQDIVQFLMWLCVLVTVREGGKGNATVRQLFKPDFALRTINPVIKEQRETDKRNGIKALDNGDKAVKQRAKPRNSKRPQRPISTTPALKVAAYVDENSHLICEPDPASLAARDEMFAELRAKKLLRPKRTA